MRIDSKKMNGMCTCGKEHLMVTRGAVIEAGATARFAELLREFNISGKACAVYDQNTYQAKNLHRPEAVCEVILDPENLHANEAGVAAAKEQMAGNSFDYLIAVGSGTVHDITRYCANEMRIPFVSCPTAASVDGFCSTVSAMTWGGCKKTMPGVAPDIVIADTDVVRVAPRHLALSGIGDILGKYTALADWKITHELNGEEVCSRIHDMTMDAVKAVYDCSEGAAAGDADATEQLMYALLLSGLAMQLMGNSRPASGAEHHISHLIEMEPPGLQVSSDASHGEKVGVATILISEYYHRLAQTADIAPFVRPYRTFTDAELRDCYGERLLDGILSENRPDLAESVSEQDLLRAWPAIRKIITECIPSAQDLRDLYTRVGMKASLTDLRVPEEKLEQLIYFSPSVRQRITFNRISRMLDTKRMS